MNPLRKPLARRLGQAPPPPIAYLLAYAGTVLTRHANEDLRPFDLTTRQYGLLVQLAVEPELTSSDLARQLGVTRQALHEMVAACERAGYLRREPGATGRTRRLALTRRTMSTLGQARAVLVRAEAGQLRALTADEIETLRRLLKRVLAYATDDESWLADARSW